VFSQFLIAGAILELYSIALLSAGRHKAGSGSYRMTLAIVATAVAIQGLVGLAMQ
jgi:hypothetical protein